MSDASLIDAIVTRAADTFDEWYPAKLDRKATRAMIASANEKLPGGMDLSAWFACRSVNQFMHDVLGLRNHYDADTGELFRGFRPRFQGAQEGARMALGAAIAVPTALRPSTGKKTPSEEG